MSQTTTTLIAAALIAFAVLFHGYLTQYTLSAAGNDGETVWRIDGSTGKVSVCGTMLSGSALSGAIASFKTAEDRANAELLSIPRCSSWSAR
jgi:hypothetical protein